MWTVFGLLCPPIKSLSANKLRKRSNREKRPSIEFARRVLPPFPRVSSSSSAFLLPPPFSISSLQSAFNTLLCILNFSNPFFPLQFLLNSKRTHISISTSISIRTHMTYMCIYMPRCIMSFLFFRVRVFLIVPLYFYPSFFFLMFATWFDPCFGILHRNFDVSICLYVKTQRLIDWFVFCERTWELGTMRRGKSVLF